MARQEEFGRWLIGRLVELQLSKAELARLVGVSGTAVHNWSTGTQPGSAFIIPLAEALKVDADEVARVTGHAGAVIPQVGSIPDLRAEFERWAAQGIELIARIGRLSDRVQA